MNDQKSPTRNPAILGFVAGAALILALAVIFLVRRDPPAPAVSTPVTPSQPAAAAPDAMPANPHAFPADRATESGPPLVSGTIEAPAISQAPGATVTVFIIGRANGTAVLAKRLEVDKFPVPFSLSRADAMAGETPQSLELEARIDLDGDAMTREPGAPTARLDGVAIGSTGLKLTLAAGGL
jgi:hypothetical protein